MPRKRLGKKRSEKDERKRRRENEKEKKKKKSEREKREKKKSEKEEKKKNPINWTGPVLAGNRLIVASTEGEVVSISPGEGSASTMFELNDGVSLPPVVANGMLYFLDDSGRISAFR